MIMIIWLIVVLKSCMRPCQCACNNASVAQLFPNTPALRFDGLMNESGRKRRFQPCPRGMPSTKQGHGVASEWQWLSYSFVGLPSWKVEEGMA